MTVRGNRWSVELKVEPRNIWIGAQWRREDDSTHVFLALVPIFTLHIVWRSRPVHAVLFCPFCGRQHIDRDGWLSRAHHIHYCEFCRHVWPIQPYTAGVPTVINEKEEISGPTGS